LNSHCGGSTIEQQHCGLDKMKSEPLFLRLSHNFLFINSATFVDETTCNLPQLDLLRKYGQELQIHSKSFSSSHLQPRREFDTIISPPIGGGIEREGWNNRQVCLTTVSLETDLLRPRPLLTTRKLRQSTIAVSARTSSRSPATVCKSVHHRTAIALSAPHRAIRRVCSRVLPDIVSFRAGL
jgi:hypothetical protein